MLGVGLGFRSDKIEGLPDGPLRGCLPAKVCSADNSVLTHNSHNGGVVLSVGNSDWAGGVVFLWIFYEE